MDLDVGPGHFQQALAGGAVGTLFMNLLLLGPDRLPHGGERAITDGLGKLLRQLRSVLLGHRAEVDLKLGGLAGELRHPELSGVSKIEAERFPGAVAVDGLLGGGHQLAVTQHHHHFFHPAVGNLLAVHVARKIQQGAAAALGGLLGGAVGGVHPGLVHHLNVQRLLRHRPDMAGDGQTLVLAQLDFREIVLFLFHGVILSLLKTSHRSISLCGHVAEQPPFVVSATVPSDRRESFRSGKP